MTIETFGEESVCLLANVCISVRDRLQISLLTLSEFKVRLPPSKKICVICLIESPLKMLKNAFYFILKALFVLKIFKFLSRPFDHVGKTA